MGLLAELFVKISARDAALKQTLAGVKTQLGGLAASGLGIGTSLGSGLARGLGIGLGGLGIAGIGVGLAKSVTGASDLAETINKVEVIFGSASAGVMKDAQEMADKFGVVKSEFMDVETSFGGLLMNMGGKTREESAKIAGDLSRLAADASSMFNVGFEEAGTKIASALRGESEPIRALNVDVSDAAVLQQALTMGMKKVNGELTTQQKVTARTAIVMNKLGVASGDLANTQDGFANSSRAVWGRVQNAMASFGAAIMPVVERALGGINKMLSGIQSWVDANGATFAAWAEAVGAAFSWVGWAANEVVTAIYDAGARMWAELETWTEFTTFVSDAWHWLVRQIKEVVDTIGVIWRNWTLIMEYTGIMIMGKVANIGEAFSWLVGAAQVFGTYLANNWVDLIRDAAVGAWTILDNLGKNIGNLFYAVWEAIQGNGFHFEFTPLLDGFRKVAADLPVITGPAFSSVEDQLKGVEEKMNTLAGKRQDDIDKAKAAAKPEAGKSAAKPGELKPGEDAHGKDRKAETTDLAGYFKSLQEGVLGKGNAAERTAVAATATAKATESSAKSLGKLAAAGAATGYAVK